MKKTNLFNCQNENVGGSYSGAVLALSKRIETLLGSQQPRTKDESRIKMLAGMLEENAAREII